MKNNLILQTDSYKFSHKFQYPKGTTHVSSYIEARGGAKESVFFGLQAFIKEYLLTPITKEDIDEAEAIVTAHGEPFYRDGWDLIVTRHGGYLPIQIEAIPEGMVLPTSNVQVQVVNTDDDFWWLPSHIETALLRGVWYPSTVATQSYQMKKFIAEGLRMTSDIPVADQIGFKLHDFGARGVSSGESAMLGGMGHLVNFMGTDTIEAIIGAKRYYNEPMAGFSIPASEHSTMTSWGRENEAKAYENMIELFSGEGKLYACVSDSYDIFNAVRYIWGDELKEKIIQSGGTLVVRPDSGSPTMVPIEVIKILMEKFGFTTNSKGYKVLPSYIRVIQGDGITAESLPQILSNLEMNGLSVDNIAFGMGGGLLQQVNRDTLKYAMKASAIKINGVWSDVYKDPIHGGKTSKKGRLKLVYQGGVGHGEYRTMKTDGLFVDPVNLLRPVYVNGELLNEQTFAKVRETANKYFVKEFK